MHNFFIYSIKKKSYQKNIVMNKNIFLSKLYRLGKTGVEFYGHLPCSDHAITKLIFVPNQVIILFIIL